LLDLGFEAGLDQVHFVTEAVEDGEAAAVTHIIYCFSAKRRNFLRMDCVG
jgi:hypothetical protein